MIGEDWALADLLVERHVFWTCWCGRTQADHVKTVIRRCRSCGVRVRVRNTPNRDEPVQNLSARIRERVRAYDPGK